MDYKNYKYTILCEDRAHYNFVRGWLKEKGANVKYKITPTNFPTVISQSSNHVVNNFPQALNAVKRKSASTKHILIVVIDADNKTVSDRLNEFSYNQDDPVFFIIPKWSIDTWFRYIDNPQDVSSIDESKTYKKDRVSKGKFAILGKIFAKMNINDTTLMPESLKLTYERAKDTKQRLGLNS